MAWVQVRIRFVEQQYLWIVIVYVCKNLNSLQKSGPTRVQWKLRVVMRYNCINNFICTFAIVNQDSVIWKDSAYSITKTRPLACVLVQPKQNVSKYEIRISSSSCSS